MQKIDKDYTVHLCVDMQNMFADETPWQAPWAQRVLPRIEALAAHNPAQCVFTRFIPAQNADAAQGQWQKYYRRWHNMTLDEIDPAIIELVPSLASFCPPAAVIDKQVYSPWAEPTLQQHLHEKNINTLIISGGEADMCVLAAVMGAVDRGYRVILAADAVCSADDQTYDAILKIYKSRYAIQIEPADTQEIIKLWQ